MKIHPVCKLFPDMGEEQFKDLVKDIEENGQMEPILMYKDRVIDGRHRLRACKMLGIEPKFEEWNGEGSLVKFVVSRNLHRRHLNASQKAMIATDMLPLLEKEAEHRKLKPLQEQAERVKDGKATNHKGKGRQKPLRRATDEAAESVGVSGRQVVKAKQLKKKAPELAEKVRKGEMSANAAKKLADASPAERKAALKKAKAVDPKTGKKVGIKKAIKDIKPKKAPPKEVNASRLAANLDRLVKAMQIVDEKLSDLVASAKKSKALPLKRTATTKHLVTLAGKISTKVGSLVAEE